MLKILQTRLQQYMNCELPDVQAEKAEEPEIKLPTFAGSSKKQEWSYPVVSDLCDTMECGLPGSSIHRIFQAREMEWVAISFSRGSSQPRNRTQVSHTAGRL